MYKGFDGEVAGGGVDLGEGVEFEFPDVEVGLEDVGNLGVEK